MPVDFNFSSAGTYTIEDDGIRGNGVSVIRDSTGTVIFTIVHPADAVNLTASVPGVRLIFNVPDSFGTANVTVGSLSDQTQCPDFIEVNQLRTDAFITLAAQGTITESGSDAPADIIAAGLILSAIGGIGTGANAIETQIVFLEAETIFGGINLVNSGNMQVGGLTPEVQGLFVLDGGDLSLTTTGFILLADATGASSVRGGDVSGNVTLTALGADADILTNINQKAVSNAGGGITLNAGRDVVLGTSGANFDNDLLATTFVTIRAGRDFLLDGTSNVRTGAFGGVIGGPIDIQAGRNIHLSNTTGGLQTIEAFEGAITLTTGPGGAFIEDAAFPGAIRSSRAITLTTDNVQINSGGLNTTGTDAILIRPVTRGRAIDIGNTLDPPAALALSDAELDLLFTIDLRVGDSNSGPVEFTAPISPTVVPMALSVRSATEILVRSTITMDNSLTFRAGDDIFFLPGAIVTTSAGGFFGFVDQAQDDGGAGGNYRLDGGIFAPAGASITGGPDNDRLIGGAANETLSGLGGNDVLDGGAGVDTTIGGPGNDSHFVERSNDVVVEAAGGGNDRVFASTSYTLAEGVHVETLSTTDDSGVAFIDLRGNSLPNTLIGNAGINLLDGAGGADQMIGGPGNDSYRVDVAGDIVTEAAGEGTDTVVSTITYTLAANLENLTLIGGASVNGTGNGVPNVLRGNGADNVLNGLAGADTMIGGAGNDTYHVDTGADVVTENPGEGTDAVVSAASFTLSADVENLTLIGAANINGNGNDLANTIAGNSGNNVLNGDANADAMSGGDGDDTYVVDNIGDVASETSATGGNDLVQASVSFTLGANIERLTLTGAGNVTGRGNALVNTIIGNNGNNRLEGEGGADVMRGLLGNDIYEVDQAGDVVDETGGGGIDTVESLINFTLGAAFENLTLLGAALTGTGNGSNNVIIGNANANTLSGLGGNDTLNGGTGADSMAGGLGDDIYVIDNAGDTVTEAAGEGTDTVQSAVTHTLGANFEKLTLTGVGNINGTGNALANTINGNAGNNLLDGGAGIDAMFGGNGNDTYIVDTLGDTATEVSAAGGTDIVLSAVTFQLNTNVENLTLTGAAPANATGNGIVNTLIGNSANNRLDGRAGADTMQGGLGNDTYVVDDAGDVVTELAGEGTDTVESSVTFTLPPTLENLTLTGAAAINGTGNNIANTIRGNGAANTLTGLAGNDRLDGGGGADTMVGGNDDDTYVVDNVGDVVTESAGGGIDRVEVSFSYTLPAEVERLTLTGIGNANGTGNGLANVLNGNVGSNTLDGAGGADMMFGGDGNDTYMVDNVGDTATEVSDTGGTDRVISTVTFILGNRVENLTLAGAAAIDGRGNALDNAIVGNGATNVLRGGLGADTLTGNGGNDRFRYDDVAESTSAVRDDITDFSAGDLIDLSVIDGNGAAAGNAFTFIGASAFSGTAGELRVVALGGGGFLVEGDTNGDSVADLVIDVTAIGGHVLGVGDFVL